MGKDTTTIHHKAAGRQLPGDHDDLKTLIRSSEARYDPEQETKL